MLLGRRAVALQPDAFTALCELVHARLRGDGPAPLEKLRVFRLRRALALALRRPAALDRRLIESLGGGGYRLNASVRVVQTPDFAAPPAGHLLPPNLHADLVRRLPILKRHKP